MNLNRLAILIGTVAAPPVLCAAHADVVVVTPSRDNTLYEHAGGGLSNGSGEHFFTGLTAVNEVRRGLIHFDIHAAVPRGSTIESVTLTLNCSLTPPATSPTAVSLHAARQDWGEGESDAEGAEGAGTAAEPGDATWLHTFYDTDLWDNAGGDFDPTSSATQTVGASTGFYSWTGGTMAADVQGWLDDPASNDGWFLVGDEQTLRSARRFDSREHAIEANRPSLMIAFTPPDVVIVCPESAHIQRGRVVSGDFEDICGSDNARWAFRPDALAATIDPPIVVAFESSVGAIPAPLRYTFRFETRATETGVFMLIELFNYHLNAYQGTLIPNISTGDITYEVERIPNADEFIGPSGDVRARASWTRPAGVPPFWNVQIDHVEWEIDL